MASTDGNGVNHDVPAVTVRTTGLYLVGLLLGYKDLKPREYNGQTYRNTEVGLLVGGEMVSVQYQDHEAAVEAAGAASKDATVALRVESRSGIKDGRPWQFYVGFRGGSLDASEYGF